VFIGEGWHSIMQEAAQETNTALLWFFALYVLSVGMLFSNLFVGIIITLFEESQSARTTSCGQLDLIFSDHIIGMKKPKKARFFKHLGYLASLLYAPAMKSATGLLVLVHKYRWAIIERFGSNIELWAATMIQTAFKLQRGHKLAKAIKLMKRSMDSLNEFSYNQVYKAADEAWNELLLENSGKGGTGQVPPSAAMELAREVCSKLDLPKVLQQFLYHLRFT